MKEHIFVVPRLKLERICCEVANMSSDCFYSINDILKGVMLKIMEVWGYPKKWTTYFKYISVYYVLFLTIVIDVMNLKVFGNIYKTTVVYQIVLHYGGFSLQDDTENLKV